MIQSFYANIFILLADHHHEISGSKARLTLIRLRAYFQSSEHNHTDDGTKRFIRLLTSLSHIQHLAYLDEQRRTSKSILALYNLSYIFSLDYCKVGTNSFLLTLYMDILITLGIIYVHRQTILTNSCKFLQIPTNSYKVWLV